MKSAICLTAISLTLTAPAYAVVQPTPGKDDSRIRFVNYNPHQIVEIWTAPGGILTLQFAEDESVPEGNVAKTDGSRLQAVPRGNFLYLKSTAKEHDTPCMVPEPLLITTKLPNGQLRPYHFQVETKPTDCSETPAAQAIAPRQAPGFQLTSTAQAAPAPPKPGNLRYVKDGGLAAGADVMYAVVFKYPGDEAAKRATAARIRETAAQRQQADLLLKQQTSWPYGNQFDGSWNFKYVAHGSAVPPAQIRDNGYQTVFLFPQMERVPSFYRLQPGATGCNREHDDHNEATVIPSVHRSGADGDTIIAPSTAQGWCLRDGKTVLEVLNFAYAPTGATPATGTVSPYVQRSLKGDSDPHQPEPQQPIPPPQSEAPATAPQPSPVVLKKVQAEPTDVR